MCSALPPFDFQSLNPPYYPKLRQRVTSWRADQAVILSFDDLRAYACSMCGISCRRPWSIPVTQSYHARWSQDWPDAFQVLPRRARGRYYAELQKRPDGSCVFLQADGRCQIHAQWGAEHKPEACQRYPYQYQVYPNGYGYVSLLASCSAVPNLLNTEQPLQFALLPASDWQEAADVPMAESWSRERFVLWLGLSLDVLAQFDTVFAAQWHLMPALAQLLQTPKLAPEAELALLDELYAQSLSEDAEQLGPSSAQHSPESLHAEWERLTHCLSLHLEELQDGLPHQSPGGPPLAAELELALAQLCRGYYQRLLPVMAYRGQRFEWQYLNLGVRLMALDLRARYELHELQGETPDSRDVQGALGRALNRVAFCLGDALEAEIQPLLREFRGTKPFDSYRRLIWTFAERFKGYPEPSGQRKGDARV